MCLYIEENSKIRVTTEDITCYKNVYYLNSEVVQSSWYSKIYEFGKEYVEELQTIPEFNTIDIGFHSYIHKDNAIEKIDGDDWRADGNTTVECTIPKGSRYWKGITNSYKNYCSNRIIINKIIYQR